MTKIPATMRTPLRAAPLFLLLALAVPPAAAMTFQVDTPVDLPDGNILDKICSYQQIPDSNQATCSLRAAVQQANAIGLADDPNPIAIHLVAGETYYVAGAANEGDVSGSTGDLDISRPMAIGVAEIFDKATIRRTEGDDRLFELHAGAAGSRLFGMRMKNSQGVGVGCILRTQPSAGALELKHIEVFESDCSFQFGSVALYNAVTTISDSEFRGGERAMWVSGWNSGANVTIDRTTFRSQQNRPVIVLTHNATATIRYSTFSDTYRPLTVLDSNLFVIGSTFSSSAESHIVVKTEKVGPMIRIDNSLFREAGAPSCSFFGANFSDPVMIAGTVDVSGSVFDDGACVPNNNPPAVPNLHHATIHVSTLGDHGGATQTHELLPTSDGIDWIPPQFCQANGTDQRGYPRAVDYSGLQPAHCDAGATELQTQPPLPEGHIFRDGFESD